MTIGNFNERKGKATKNRIKGNDLEIIYGLAGNDSLISKNGSSIEGLETTILVGGAGNDINKAGKRKTTVILDNGKSKKDTLIARGIGLNSETSFVVEVDNRHLYAGDRRSGQYVVLLDWQKAKHRIERIRLSDRQLSYKQLVNSLESFANYFGNVSWAELERSGEADLGRLGLSPGNINPSIRKIEKRATKLERSRSAQSVDTLTGGSSDTPLVGADEFQGSSYGSQPEVERESLAIAPLSEREPLTLMASSNELPGLLSDPLPAGLPSNPFMESNLLKPMDTSPF